MSGCNLAMTYALVLWLASECIGRRPSQADRYGAVAAMVALLAIAQHWDAQLGPPISMLASGVAVAAVCRTAADAACGSPRVDKVMAIYVVMPTLHLVLAVAWLVDALWRRCRYVGHRR